MSHDGTAVPEIPPQKGESREPEEEVTSPRGEGKSPEKSADKSRRKSRGIPQPHGGVLIPGAGRGPAKGAPNAGRPPSAVRAILREAFVARVPLAEAIADDPALAPTERLRALDLLGRYGLGTTRELSVEDVKERLAETVAAVRRIVPAPHAGELLAKLRQVWT